MIANPSANGTSAHNTSEPIAVIGAGPGGLASAMLLQASGHDVVVYEGMDHVGGRTGRISQGDYHFDRGPTFFLMPYVLEEIFAAANLKLTDYVDLKRLDPMYRLLIGRPEAERKAGVTEPYVIDATQDLDEMARRLGEINPPDGAAFSRFIMDNRAKLKAAEPILRRPIRNVFDLVRPDAMKAGAHIKPHMSVHQLLSRYFEHYAVRLGVSFQSKYLGMSPYDCPSLFTILPFIEYEYGIWHPIGGCNALTKAMADAFVSIGGEVRTSSPVEKLTFEGRRATGVVVDGEAIAHSNVVMNADAAWAIKNLIPQELRQGTKYTDAKLDAKKYSCSTFMLYLGVDGEIDLPHHTIYMSEKYKQNLEDISVTGKLSEDPSIYLCNPSRIDPTLAPAGKSSLYVLMPTPNCSSGVDWEAQTQQLRETCYAQLEKRMGISDLRSRVEEEIVYTPNTWKGMNINFGATFNLAHNLGQMLHKRPQHRLEGYDGVWLVGGGTHPGSGLPVIFLSAQITSRLLCEETGKPYSGASVPVLTESMGSYHPAQVEAISTAPAGPAVPALQASGENA